MRTGKYSGHADLMYYFLRKKLASLTFCLHNLPQATGKTDVIFSSEESVINIVHRDKVQESSVLYSQG